MIVSPKLHGETVHVGGTLGFPAKEHCAGCVCSRVHHGEERETPEGHPIGPPRRHHPSPRGSLRNQEDRRRQPPVLLSRLRARTLAADPYCRVSTDFPPSRWSAQSIVHPSVEILYVYSK